MLLACVHINRYNYWCCIWNLEESNSIVYILVLFSLNVVPVIYLCDPCRSSPLNLPAVLCAVVLQLSFLDWGAQLGSSHHSTDQRHHSKHNSSSSLTRPQGRPIWLCYQTALPKNCTSLHTPAMKRLALLPTICANIGYSRAYKFGPR